MRGYSPLEKGPLIWAKANELDILS